MADNCYLAIDYVLANNLTNWSPL